VARPVRIFVSSTMIDLQEERKCIREVIEEKGGIAILAEDFREFSRSSEMAIKKRLVESDGYIGILDKKYGFIPPENNPNSHSVTHIEYNIASKLHLPMLILKSEINEESRDTDNNNHRLNKLLTSISKYNDGNWIYEYKDLNELKTKLQELIPI
jgi:Domain of unknown function (DUF4062)